ncbi:MAG: transglycosylase SLT domain-containing protein [bacterium]|nr:transglycosylase SLT domain-containing protein [bacterium]
MTLPQRILRLAAMFAVLAMTSPGAFAAVAQRLDAIVLKTGTTLEGCIVLESSAQVKIENVAGSFSIPRGQIQNVVHAGRGESEFLLGKQLFDRQKYDRARTFLTRAGAVVGYKAQARDMLDRIDEAERKLHEQEQEKQSREIEDLIRRKGVKSALEELQRREKRQGGEEDQFWGGLRGQLHMTMARERMDHLDLRNAERHLALAADYGVNPDEWNKLREELVAMRTQRLRFGESALEEYREKLAQRARRVKPGVTGHRPDFLNALASAQTRGEKLPPLDYLKWIDQYARTYDLDPLLVWAMIDVESAWRVKAKSPVGAQGLMQLMPETAREVDVDDPYDPESCIQGGIRYMRFLLDVFGDEDTALAAYNTGPGTVERNGVTDAGKRYVDKVRSRFDALSSRYTAWARG